jgi:PAS domain S-box-containing protein
VGSTFFETTPDPIWGVDLTSQRFVDANDAALAFSGYTEEELFSKSLADVYLPDAVKAMLSHCVPSANPAFLSSPYCAGKLAFKKRDGSSEVLEMRCYAMKFGSQTQYLYLIGKRLLKK